MFDSLLAVSDEQLRCFTAKCTTSIARNRRTGARAIGGKSVGDGGPPIRAPREAAAAKPLLTDEFLDAPVAKVGHVDGSRAVDC